MALLFFSISSISHSASVSFTKGSDNSVLAWRSKQTWVWQTNKEKAEIYQTNIILIPVAARFVRAETVPTREKDGKLKLLMNRLSEKLFFKFNVNEKEELVTVVAQPAKLQVNIRNCEQNDLRVNKPASLPSQFFLGIACRNINGKITVDISAPADFDWGASSQIESKGKGESWRSFELGNIQAADGVVLKFSLVKDDKEYSFGLVSQKKQGQKNIEKNKRGESQFAANIAMYSLGVVTTTATFSGSAPGFSVEGWTAPVWKSLRFGADYEYAQPSADETKSIDFNQFHLSGSWPAKFQNGFLFDSRLFLISVSSSQGAAGVSLKHSNLGAGILTGFQMGSSSLQLGASMSHFGSKSVTSSMAFSLGYIYKISTYGWQIRYDSQNFSTETVSGKQVKFGQSYISLGMVF